MTRFVEGDRILDLQITPRGDSAGGDPGPGEKIMLGAVRLASLPFILFVIVLASLIYGIATLARNVAVLAAVCFRRSGSPARAWDRPAKAQDS